MLEVCPTIAGDCPRVEVHPLSIGGREDPARLVFTAAPGDGVVVGWCDLGDRFRWVANEVDVVHPCEPLPNLPVARAVWQPRPDFPTATEGWLTAGGPHHTVLSTALGAEELTDLAEVFSTELVLIDADRRAEAWPRNCAGARPTTAWPGASDRRLALPPSSPRHLTN